MSRLAFPFAAAASGRAAAVSYGDDAHVRQMLELLVLTMPGERVMRPDFGSPVAQMLFAPSGGAVAHALEAALHAAIDQQLAALLTLRDLTVAWDETDAALTIEVVYEVIRSKTMAKAVLRKDRL
ncbi:GPW/gp25 family protein [Sphingomonas nostoxanthinifaciens]|uniref:GPW/gp25 family protein n=1 Tax=Sphingomonas nostoxanthinifaciens TaxID=2872652 RepID=UPI001CC1D9DF|nr:GPW/gp25 family protein [Sphingomonas nostoxanthinifaciens]UAK23288.1 GPW/gp25 family protein [Sphingomonas nostoxanthinifaciens]